MPRIRMISNKSEIAPEQHAEFDSIVEVLHGVRGPFSVLMHSPGLAQKVMEAGAQVRLGSTLSQLERELAVIAVSREKDARYEWAAHVKAGRAAGMREEAIEAVRHRQDVNDLEADERDIILTNKIERPLFDQLVSRHSERWLVELAATVGQYQYISAINNTFEVEPATDADQLLV
jgi:4-carboxymuconolactone decarboxylase